MDEPQAVAVGEASGRLLEHLADPGLLEAALILAEEVLLLMIRTRHNLIIMFYTCINTGSAVYEVMRDLYLQQYHWFW